MRLYYTAKSINYQDISYLEGVMDLWAIAEETCGILAVCLPLSPKFFESVQDSKLWSRFRTSLLSLTQSHTGATRCPETSPEESKAAKLSNEIDSPNLQANFARCISESTHSMDLVSIPGSDSTSSERVARNHHDRAIA